MPRGKQESAEQIIPKLRVVEVEVARGKTVAESKKKDSGDRADVLPLEEEVWRPSRRPGEAAQEA